jgi:flagellar hook-length control protein FliK
VTFSSISAGSGNSIPAAASAGAPTSFGFARAGGAGHGTPSGFEALLAAVAALIEQATGIDVTAGATHGAATTSPGGNDNAATTPAGAGADLAEAAGTALADPAGAPATPSAGISAPTTPSAGSGEGGRQTVLGSLGDALAAIERALAEGDKPDKASLDKLDDALDALAGILNMPPPSPPAATPASGSAAAGDAATSIGAAKPAGFTLDAQTLLDLLAGRGAALPPRLADMADDKAPALSGVDIEVAPKSVLAGLSGKLTALAGELDASAPELAAKLADLGQKLGSADPGPAALAKLGFAPETRTADQQAAAALAAPTSKASGNEAAPKPFAPAQLSLPDGSALSGKPADTGEAGAATVAPGHAAAKPAASAAADGSGSKSGSDPDPDPGKKPTARMEAAATIAREASAPASARSGGDGGQPASQVLANGAPTNAVPASFRPVQAAYQPPPGALNLPQFAFQFVHQVSQGNNHFELRLDPPDLGRVDVKLHMDPSGAMTAHMAVERTDTLDLMQRDRPQLERALAQAGLDAGKTNLQFSLNQNPFSQQQGGGNQRPAFNFPQPGPRAPDPVETPILAQPVRYRGVLTPGGINLFV